jgi:hypothetical protein
MSEKLPAVPGTMFVLLSAETVQASAASSWVEEMVSGEM